jgi:hypothetical protein
MKTPLRERNASRAFQLEIAGGIAQETEKLMSGDEELKRTRTKFLLHNKWITQIASIRHRIQCLRKSVRNRSLISKKVLCKRCTTKRMDGAYVWFVLAELLQKLYQFRWPGNRGASAFSNRPKTPRELHPDKRIRSCYI